MATKSYNPTANSFELLANADLHQDAPERKAKAKKQEEEEQTGAIPTPAAKAQARQAAKAKEAATKVNQASNDDTDFTQTQSPKDQPRQPKLSREQYLEGKKKGTLSTGTVDEEGFALAGRRTRERKENTHTNDTNGNRGRGNHERGRGRGGRGGRGRGPRHDDEGTPASSPGGERSRPPKPREEGHHYQPPNHGRSYDKKSGMKTGKNAQPKKGGAGGGIGSLGTDKDEWEGQTGVPEPAEVAANDQAAGGDDAGWGDNPTGTDTNANASTTETTGTDKPADETAEEEGPVELSLEAYLKLREEAAAKLLEKVGKAPEPRSLEAEDRNLKGFTQISKYEESAEQKKENEKKAKADARRGEKALNVDDVFQVHTPPVAGGRGGRGRGRGRGGRGHRGDGDRGGRGHRGDGDRGDRGDHGDRGGRSHRGDRENRGDRGDRENRGDRGDRENRGDGDRSDHGDREDRPPRAEGERRGGRGQRGDGQRGGGRGGRGRGGRGARRFDSSSQYQFPDLGSQ